MEEINNIEKDAEDFEGGVFMRAVRRTRYILLTVILWTGR